MLLNPGMSTMGKLSSGLLLLLFVHDVSRALAFRYRSQSRATSPHGLVRWFSSYTVGFCMLDDPVSSEQHYRCLWLAG
jgi:hypothetical protein